MQYNRRRTDRIKEAIRKNLSPLYVFFPVSILYMELIVKMACFDETPGEALLYTGLFSVSVGLGCCLLASLWKPKTNEVLTVVLLTLLTLLFIAQTVYFKCFKTLAPSIRSLSVRMQ